MDVPKHGFKLSIEARKKHDCTYPRRGRVGGPGGRVDSREPILPSQEIRKITREVFKISRAAEITNHAMLCGVCSDLKYPEAFRSQLAYTYEIRAWMHNDLGHRLIALNTTTESMSYFSTALFGFRETYLSRLYSILSKILLILKDPSPKSWKFRQRLIIV